MSNLLKDWQVQLMAEVLAARTPLASTVHLRNPVNGYEVGTIVIPAHVEDDWVDVPEQRHAIRYSPGYGILCRSLTDNGNARLLVQCCWEGSYFEPLTPLDPAHVEAERARILEGEAKWAAVRP